MARCQRALLGFQAVIAPEAPQVHRLPERQFLGNAGVAPGLARTISAPALPGRGRAAPGWGRCAAMSRYTARIFLQ